MSEILYGIRANSGEIVNINEVANGLKCNCLCPHCNVKLIAKTEGKKKKPHFAHYEDSNRECNASKANESALHKMAKDIVLEEKAFRIPALKIPKKNIPLNLPLEISAQLPNDYTHKKAQKIAFDYVELEKQYSNFQPDIVGFKADGKLFIEIAVTHFVDDKKAESVAKMGISMVEVDLSQFIDVPISKEKLKENLLESDELKKWIYNRHYKEAESKAYDLFQNHKITIKYNNKKRIEEEKKRKKEEIRRREQIAESKRLAELKIQYPNNELKIALALWDNETKCLIAKNMLNDQVYMFYYDPMDDFLKNKGVWGRKSIGKKFENGREKNIFDEQKSPVKHWNKPVWVIEKKILKENPDKEKIYVKS